jgi:membrane protease subunit HflK
MSGEAPHDAERIKALKSLPYAGLAARRSLKGRGGIPIRARTQVPRRPVKAIGTEREFMPWSNQSGGGGPWGGGGGNSGGPWGQGPRGTGGGPQGTPPDLEAILRRGQDRLKRALPGGGGGGFAIGILIIAVLVVFWAFKSIYTVQPDELGQELFLGKPKTTVEEPGLHFMWWPIEQVEIVQTQQIREAIGSFSNSTNDESQMLSGDQNIIDVDFTVIWRVTDPKKFLFNIDDPEQMVRSVAESAMREFVGRTPDEEVRTGGRQKLEESVQKVTQTTLDAYNAGISVVGVQLEKADPPAEVADAFEEVQRAQQDQDRFQREADAYANKKLGDARGEASRLREEAQGYKQSVIAQAQGEAARFVSVFNEYKKAEDVTRKRLYLETMEKVLGHSNKIIIDEKNGQGIVPYLPLDQLMKQSLPKLPSQSVTNGQGMSK